MTQCAVRNIYGKRCIHEVHVGEHEYPPAGDAAPAQFDPLWHKPGMPKSRARNLRRAAIARAARRKGPR